MQVARFKQYQTKITRQVVRLGYRDLLDFFSQNLGRSLLELATELGESYYVFQAFHTQYVENWKGRTDADDKNGASG